jgi:glycosyltransferase involved in cell wall biosynthesis
MTVVQLLPALESGGVERSTLEISAALTQAGQRALVVSAGGRLLPALREVGAEHFSWAIGRKSPWTLRYISALRSLFVRERVDIVHARSRLPAWIGYLAWRGMPAARRPHFITTMHGLNSSGRYSAIMTRGERVICVSDTVRRYLLERYPATDARKLRVIARGIDPEAFPARPRPDPAARAAVGERYPALKTAEPLLLLPGRGTRLKGHADALRLLAVLRREGYPRARLWLPGACEVGREDYLNELRAEAERLGIAEAALFTPATSRMAEAYAASDLVLQLSRKPEAFGRTVVEALSVGRPVLGWAHGGVGELLSQLQPQGAVTPFDEAALARIGIALLKDPPPFPATIPYTLRAMQTATLAVYEELLG